MIDWDDYRILLAIAREHTLSGAARRLKVDQSTVSRRLATLERAANARLFDRTPDGYVLTTEGEAILPKLEQIERSTIDVERTLVGREQQLEGRVRLAVTDSFAAWFLVPHLHGLRAAHPGIVLELITGNVPVDLARREADLSLRMRKPEQPQLVMRQMGSAAWAVYAAESYVAARGLPDLTRRLAGHDVITLNDDLRGTAGAAWLRQHADQGRVVVCANSMVSQAAAVVAGLGVSPLPCVFGDPQPGLVRVSAETVGQHDIWLVVHPDVKTSSRVRAVMAFLTQLMAAEEPLLSGQRPRLAPKPVKARRRKRGG